MFDLLQALADAMNMHLLGAGLLFLRVGAIAGLAPGFGETFLPARLRLGVAIALTLLAYPAIDHSSLPSEPTPAAILVLGATEVAAGLMIGIALRLIVMALQFAGSIAAQTTSLAQIAGAGIAPEPMPAVGNVLLIAGLTLAMILGLPAKLVLAIVWSYQSLPFGVLLPGSDVAPWGLAQAVSAFSLGFSLAAPFVVAAFLYNIALGAINKAMPQLMVAFIGAPAITGATILILLLAAPVILSVWHGRLQELLAAPAGLSP